MSLPVDSAELETRIRVAIEVQEWVEAATFILTGYGPELVTYLLVLLSEHHAVTQGFSRLGSQIWRNLADCPSDVSVRTWTYQQVRQAAFDASNEHWKASEDAWSGPELTAIANKVLSGTLEYLASSSSTKGSILRRSLERDDRELLLLRIDRKFEWSQLAYIMTGRMLLGTELSAEVSRLKRQFDMMTSTLRDNARRLGLSGKSGP